MLRNLSIHGSYTNDKNYNKIARDRVWEDISLDKVTSKRLGLKSLCSGTIMGNALVDPNGDLHREYQLNTYKLDWVKSFLEDFKDRVVIFYQYDHQRNQLYDMITKMKRPCARYCAEFKEENIFNQNDDAVVLVQYKSGSTGIDWLKQSYVCIFYCLPDSYIEFYQAKGRINRVGDTQEVDFQIDQEEAEIIIELWVSRPDKIDLTIIQMIIKNGTTMQLDI